MKCFKITCIIIFSFLVVLPLPADQSLLNQILPKEMEAKGWVLEEEPFIAFNEASLSMILNGAAPRYMELGTKKAAFANYVKKQVYLMLEIYETDSTKNAKKIYKEFASDNSEPLDNIGVKARFTSEMGGTYMAEYFQDRFYVRVSIMQKFEKAKKSILECAKTISDRITKSTMK